MPYGIEDGQGEILCLEHIQKMTKIFLSPSLRPGATPLLQVVYHHAFFSVVAEVFTKYFSVTWLS